MTAKKIIENLKGIQNHFHLADRYREQGEIHLDYTTTVEPMKLALAKQHEDKAEFSMNVLSEILGQPRETILDMVFDIDWARNILKEILK